MIEFHLLYGNGGKPYARLVEHDRYPDMWRVVLPGGPLWTSCAALDAAKAEAEAIVCRMPQIDTRRLRWAEVKR
jgi:hypothetical protein